jgi:hypothetical protein
VIPEPRTLIWWLNQKNEVNIPDLCCIQESTQGHSQSKGANIENNYRHHTGNENEVVVNGSTIQLCLEEIRQLVYAFTRSKLAGKYTVRMVRANLLEKITHFYFRVGRLHRQTATGLVSANTLNFANRRYKSTFHVELPRPIILRTGGPGR